MAKLNFEFESSGGKQVEQQFKAIGQRIEASEGSLKGLAKALGVSEKELESLAKELGVNGVGLKKLSTYLANSTAAGKQSQEQFAAIAKSIAGLKPETFDRLQRAVKASVTDTAKAADQTEQLAKGYDKAAKSAEKAAKAGSGISNTTFSKEASADRRNASENARLARQSSEKIAGDNRAAQVAIAEADRISAEKQAAAKVEADQQIAKIQANTAQDIAKFSAAQEAIQREKDRALDAEIAAAQDKTNRELGRLSAATAKEIAASDRALQREEKANDRVAQAREAAADRRVQQEIAQLNAETTRQTARLNRESQAIEGVANRATQERIAGLQAQTAQEIAAEQRKAAAIEREKDRANQQEIAATRATVDQAIAAAKNRNDQQIAADRNANNTAIAAFKAESDRVTAIQKQQLANESAERIAASKRQSDELLAAVKVEGQREAALQKQQLANQSREKIAEEQRAAEQLLVAFKSEADRQTALQRQQLANESRERVAAQKQQSDQLVAELRASYAQETALQKQELANQSREKIAEEKRAADQFLAEFRANASRQAALERQILANQSREQIASEQRVSQERQKELDRAQREQLATFKSALAAETSTYNTQLRIASVERQKEIDRQLKIQENNRKAQERATARQQQALAKTQQSQQQGSAATVTASEVLDVPLAEAKRLASELDLNARQLSQGIPALKKLYEEGNATGVELQRAKELFSLTNRQLQGLIPAIKAAVAAQTEAANDQSAQAIDAARAKAVDRFAQTIGKSGTEALELARDLKLTADQMRGAGSAIDQLAKEGGLSLAELRRVRDTYGISRQATVALARAIRERVDAEKAEAERVKNRKKQDAQDRAQSQEASKRTAALPSFASTLGVLPTEAQELADRFKLTSTQMTAAVKEINALAKTGGLVDAELDRIQRTYQLQGDAIAALTAKVKKQVADEDEIAQQRKADKANDATARKAKADQIRADREAAAQARKRQAEQQAQDRARQQEASKRTAALPGFANVLGVLPTEAQQLADQFRLTSTQMTAATREINALAESGNLVDAELDRIQRTYRLQDGAIAALTAKIRKRVSDEDAAAEQRRAEKTANAAERKAQAERIRADRAAAADERKRQAERQSQERAQQQEQGRRVAALPGLANALGVLPAEAKALADDLGLTSVQMVAAAREMASLARSGGLVESELVRLGESYGFQDRALTELSRRIQAQADAVASDIARRQQAKADDAAAQKSKAEQIRAEREAAAAARKRQADQQAQERIQQQEADRRNAALAGFASAIGLLPSEAKTLADDMSLTSAQMVAAAREMATLAKSGSLVEPELARLKATYGFQDQALAELSRRIQSQADAVAADVARRQQSKADDAAARKAQADRIRADREAAAQERKRQAELEAGNRARQQEASRRDAATPGLASILGVLPSEAKALSDDLGLTSTQMTAAAKEMAALAKAGALVEPELARLKTVYGFQDRALAELSRQIQAQADAIAQSNARQQQAKADDAAARKAKADQIRAERAAAVESRKQQSEQQSQARAQQQESDRRNAALAGLATALGVLPSEAKSLADDLGLTSVQMTAAAKEMAALAKAGNLVTPELERLKSTYGFQDRSLSELSRRIQAQADAIAQESERQKQAKSDDAAARKAKADQIRADREAARAERERTKALDRQRTEESKRSQAIAATSNATGIDSQQLQGLVDATKLTETQIRQGIPALKKLFDAGTVTADQLRLTAQQYGIQANQAAQLVPVLRARAAAEKEATDRAKKDDAAKSLAAAQEKAALGFAQILGQPRDQALALAKDLKLTGEQMGPASKAIAKLATDSKLTGAALADVADQYRLNVTQAKTLAGAIAQRVNAEKQVTQAALEQSNQQSLAGRSDAVDQKRIAALDQFAATLGISKDAALDLARRFGLTDAQMKGAGAKITALAEAGQLTESELALVRQQFKVGRAATQELTQAIARRVAEEKKQSDQKATDAANAALAKAAIGLGVAIGKSTDEAIALAKELGLTAAQAKAVPAAFNRLTKAGITGQQAIDDLAREAGLNAKQSAALAQSLSAEANRIQSKADQDKTTEANNALRVASVELAQRLGVSADQVFAFAQGASLGAKELKTAVTKIGAFVQGADQSEQALKTLAQGLGLNEKAAQQLYRRLLAEANAKGQEAQAAKQQQLAQRANQVEQQRIAALSGFADALGLTTDEARTIADRFSLTGDQMKGVGARLLSLAKAGKLTEDELALVQQQFRLGSAATATLTQAIRDRVAREEQQATDQGNARLAKAADAAEQKRIEALGKFADALGLTPAAARDLVDRFNLTGEQMRGVATSFNRLVKSNQLTEDQLALVQQSYRLGSAATDALTVAVRQRVATEQAAADQQAALDAETARQERIKKELKAAYRQEQAALEKAEKADQSRTLAAIEVGRDLNVAAEQIARFADATGLSGAQLKTATRAITKSLEAGTLDQDLAGLSKGLKLSRSAVQFLAKRIQKQADEVAAQAAAQREAEGQANLAAAADKADRERTAALSQFARTLGLTIEQAQELVSRFNLTGTQMKGAGKAIDQLAKAGLLTESELGLVRQQFGLGRSATSALVTAIEARVAAEKAEADAAAAEAARVKQREAIQKELKARYKQQQAALDKAEKADQSRALASIEVARSLNTSSDQLDRFIKSTGLSGEGLRSAARAIGKSVEGGTLNQDLASLSKGLKLSESAVRFLAGRIQKEADRVAADQAAQREATGQAGLAAAAEKADQQRTAALSQFAQTLGITIEAARDLVQRFGLTGDQMKGAAREIDKLAQAGRLTADELGLVQQRFKLGSASVSALTDAIAARVQTEKDAAATEAAATAETKRREAVKKALKARYKQEQAELEKAQKADQSRAQAAIALSQSTGIAADRLTRFADATGLAGPQLRAAVSQITTSLKAGTLDQDLTTLSQGLNLGESAIRFLAKRIQQQAATTDQAALNRAALPFAQALGQSTAEAIALAQRLGLTAEQLRAVPTAFNRLTKAGVTGEQAIADLARTVGLTDDQSRELATALQAQVDRLKAQKSQQQLGEIGTQQKAAYEAALAESAQRERERATEAAKQAGKLGLSAEQTDRFAKAADLGAKELRSAVTTIGGLVKSGTATSAALEQLAPGLGLSASAAKFLAKRLQAQADAAAKTKQDNTDQKEAQRLAKQTAKEQARQARQLTAIGEKQRDEYATAQANLAKELDKQRVAAIAFGQAIGTTSDRALRYAQALGLSSSQVAAVGPQLQKLLSAGDLQGALSLLTNTYKLSERSARLLIGKVEQRIQSEQAASDAAKQQADLQKAADAETKRRQQLAEQESAEAKKRIDALAGFAAAVGQTPDQALVLANVLKLSSDQMRALPKAIAQLVQSGNDTDSALKRLGDAYGLQDRQLRKLTNSVRAQVESQGQARLAAGANAQDQARTTALPGFAAATGLTEAAARDLVTRFNLTGAQMQLVSGEMARLAQQGKLTEQALGLLGQRAGIGSAAQQELATALQARVATEKSDNERQALKRASLQLSQALGQTGDEAIALVQSLGLTADQVKVLGPKLATLARQGDVTELALRQLQTATGAPLPALNQLAIAIRANAVAQQQSAQQSGLLQATAKLAGQLGLTADQALRLSQKLDLSAQAIGQVDALKKLYAQGPVSEAALTQFREATGLAAAEFNRLAAAVRSRVALEQRQSSEQQAARASAQASRASAAEGRATAGIVQKLDIDVSGLQKLQAETGKSAVELQKVFTALDKLEESSLSAEQKIELLARSFNVTDEQAKQLVATFDRAKTSARELGQNVASAAQDLGMTYGAALNLQKSLGLTSQQFEQAAQRAVMLRQTGATTAQAFDALNKEFGLTREQFAQLDRAALGSQQAMQGLAAAVGSFSVAFVGGLKTALQTFGEFEGELRKAGVLSESFNSNEGRQAFANLEAEVKKLGASTSFTNKQIAEASTELVKSGFTAEQTAEAIGGITKGAIATGESMQQLSEVTGAALNNFGLAASASGYINDLVVATANASPAGVEDIGEALKYVGATAAESNQSVEDIMKMIAQLASVGIKGSTAGTGLAEAMRRLKLASAGSVTEFGNLVRGNKRAVAAFQALQLQARNADGSLKPLPEIIDQLRTATAGFAQEDKDVLMNALFGVEGGRVIQAQLNLTQEKLGQIDKAFGNASGASARAADQMQQGFAGSLVMAQSAIEAFQTSVGSALAPVVTYLLQLFTGFLNTVTAGFNALPGPVKGTVGALVGLAATMTTIVAAAAAFRAAAIALGIAQGIAAAKTVALNVALAAQQGSLLNVAKAMLGFGTATTTAGTAAAAAGGGAGIKGLMTGLAGLKASAAATPAALGAVGLSVKGLAAGLGKLAGQLAIAYAAFEVLRGAWQIIQDGTGQAGAVVELRDAFADLDKKLAEIEGKDPLKTIKESSGSLADLKTEYEDFGAGVNKVFANIGDKGPIVGLQQSIVELWGVLTNSTEAVSKYGNAWGVVTQEQLRNQQLSIELARNGEKIQETFDGGQAALVAYRKALKDANGDTNAKGVQEANKAVETQIAKIREMVEVLRKAGPDGEIALKPLEAILKSLENRNPAIRPKVQMDPEQAKAQAEEAKNAAKEVLERDQFQVKAQVELEFDEAKAKRKLAFDQAAQRDSLAFSQKQDRDKLAFERQLDAERRRLEAAQNAAKASFDRGQQTAKLAFDNQQRARQDAYETAANARKDAFERGQEAKKLAFETSTETRKNTFADQQRAKEATFSQQQEARKRAFETSQLAARKAFEDQLAARDAAKKGEFDAQRAAVERQLQLEAAGSDAERAQLQEQFAKEDAQNARRQQLLAATIAQEQAWEEQKRLEQQAFEEQERLKQQAFEAQQRAEKEAYDLAQRDLERAFEATLNEDKRKFEETLRLEQQAFETAENERKRNFENELRTAEEAFNRRQETARRAFENKLAAEKEALESQLADRKLQFEQRQAQEKLKFEQDQDKVKAQFESNERKLEQQHKERMFDLEAQFKKEQRDLDKLAATESAKAVQDSAQEVVDAAKDLKSTANDLKGKGGGGPTPTPRAKGGPVKRRNLYLVGEKGPELFTPDQDGAIVPHKPTRELMGFAKGGPVRAGETIVVGEKGREAFVPANAQGLKVAIDAGKLRADLLSVFKDGVGQLTQSLSRSVPQDGQPTSDLSKLASEQQQILKDQLKSEADALRRMGKKDEADALMRDGLAKIAEQQRVFEAQLKQSQQGQQPSAQSSDDLMRLAAAQQQISKDQLKAEADALTRMGRKDEADALMKDGLAKIAEQQRVFEAQLKQQAGTSQSSDSPIAAPVADINQNVAAIAQLLQSKTNPTPRRMGGPVEAGGTYQVGEQGREIFVPQQNGRILSARDSAAVAERAMTIGQMQQGLRVSAPKQPAPAQVTGPSLRDVIRSIGEVRQGLAALGGHTFNFVGNSEPGQDVYAVMRSMRRAAIA